MEEKEAIERIKARFDKWALDDEDMKAIQTLIPELTESEDERIIRAIIDALYSHTNSINLLSSRGYQMEDIEAWLENQKESLHIPETCKENADSFTEDERIRKALIDGVRQIRCKNGITQEQMIAYLEKQKETGIQWFKSDNVKNPDKPYIDKVGMFYTTDGRMCYASEIEKQKEQKRYWKPTETDIALFNKAVTTNKALTPAERAQLDIIRSKFSCCRAVNCSGIVQKEQKPLKVGENAYFDPNTDMWFIKKEQEPADLSEMMVHKEPYIAPVPTPMVADEQKSDTRDADDLQLLGFIYDLLNEIEWKDNWTMSKDECLQRLNNYRPQKPVSISYGHENDTEWSDEDSDNLERVDNYLWMLDNYVGDDCATPQGKTDKIRENIQEVLSPWLKSLPERFSLQQKVEWSEEDEKNCNRIVRFLEPHKTFFPTKETKEEMQNWLNNRLKSLRPQPKRDCKDCAMFLNGECTKPHWKPSEEQMKALKRASTNEYLPAKQFDILVSLYEQLKKL